MKTLEWQKFFAEQRDRYNKVAFSAPELANVARTSLHGLNTELGRLLKRGIISRYAHGIYGLAEPLDAAKVLSAIDACAYITGFSGLFRHHLVTQVPTEITCFTNRRHNRRADRQTPAGTFRFICVPPAVYARPDTQPVAPPEHALCDFAWLCSRDGLDPRSLVTFRNLHTLRRRLLNKHLTRYPSPVQATVAKIAGFK